MTTETDVANLGLGYCGEGKISSIDDSASKSARTIKSVFSQLRRELLSLGNWSFAQRTLELTERAANVDFPLPHFANAFPLPAGFLRLDDIIEPKLGADEWAIEEGPTGPELLCDTGEIPIVRVTMDHLVPARWSPLFIKLFAAEIGLRCGPELNGDKGQRDRAKIDRRDALRELRSNNLQTKAVKAKGGTPFTTSRSYGSSVTIAGQHP